MVISDDLALCHQARGIEDLDAVRKILDWVEYVKNDTVSGPDERCEAGCMNRPQSFSDPDGVDYW
ncbi:hypothetical protein [Hoeflea prorocentri]|uniref:Uncharacterized protein n=1 Tax=Hoeflea prorocentri TaxID=1922333 RepID=A0A9X3UL73_9HYPH|nr:hypothetical protein [Hoeflea prorocentri]MCY6382885.1 hypothetical protein [Hoeflea prorocentri]MDA5400685.1 hypothetical protein [Hoeflea prorocentri]